MPSFEEALEGFPIPGDGVHHYVMTAVHAGLRENTPLDILEEQIRDAMPRSPRPGEIEEAIDSALRFRGSDKYRKFFKAPTRSQSDRAEEAARAVRTMKKLVHDAGGPIPLQQLAITSPVPVPPIEDQEAQKSAASLLLNTLIAPNETIFCGSRYDTGPRFLDNPEGWAQRFQKGTVPPLWIPNPLTGREAVSNAGNQSYRCDNAVTSHRYLLFEADHIELSLEIQAAFLLSRIHAGWPIRSIVFSGAKSLHALVQVDCPDAAAWSSRVNEDKEFLVGLGADPHCFNAARMSRLPGAIEDERELQTLLWLNHASLPTPPSLTTERS